VDDAIMFDGGWRSWPFRLALLVGDRDRFLGRRRDWIARLGGDKGGIGTGDVGGRGGGLVRIDRVLIRNGVRIGILFTLGLSGSLDLWRDFDIRYNFAFFWLLYGYGYNRGDP
jgi:hypothetical protein